MSCFQVPMIYHIAAQEEWDCQSAESKYAPRTYEKEGFIHCCDLHQLESVANRYFQGSDNLLVLELVPAWLEPETRYEQSGNERYPHVYGPINKDAINRSIRVQCSADGLFGGAFSEL